MCNGTTKGDAIEMYSINGMATIEELKDYIIRILNQFMNAGYPQTDINHIVELIDDIYYEDFIELYKEIFKTINSITLKIAGNLDYDLVNKIHNLIKENLIINSKSCENEESKDKPSDNNEKCGNKEQQKNGKEFNYLIDYYQKSEMKSELDGAIFVIYRFQENLNDYFQIFKGCMDAITRVNLRLEKTHSYYPNIFVENNFFMIYIIITYMYDTIFFFFLFYFIIVIYFITHFIFFIINFFIIVNFLEFSFFIIIFFLVIYFLEFSFFVIIFYFFFFFI